MQKKQTDYVRFALRINPELHERLIEFSTKNNYSLNSSINTAIDAGLEQLDPLDDKNFQAPTIADIKKQPPIRTQIRLPQELHAELVEEAKANEASLNDVMVYYLANRKQPKDNDDNKILLTDESNFKAVELMMTNIVSKAISRLMQQGVDKQIIQDAFNTE